MCEKINGEETPSAKPTNPYNSRHIRRPLVPNIMPYSVVNIKKKWDNGSFSHYILYETL